MIDKPRIENAIREILGAIGEDPNREGLLETPRRVADMYGEIFAGVGADPNKVAKLFHEESCGNMVIVKDIPLFSMCEHHLLPFVGVANVAYIPKNNTVLGLSKIARIVDILSKKPQLQERLCDEIAETISRVSNARGVFVSIEAEHLCMTMRGVKKPGAKTVSYSCRGTMLSDSNVRMEAMTMIGGK